MSCFQCVLTDLLVSPCRLCSGLNDSSMLDTACASGCNPHCHFLLLLQSISFDHSILLDFLISTETCFLEYFVRYLKYLRADRQGFTAACGRIGTSDCHRSLEKSPTASCGGDMSALTHKPEPDQAGFSSCVQPTGVVSPVEMIGLTTGLRLVEYSDESDPENMDSQDETGPSGCDSSRFSGAPAPIRQKQYESSRSTGSLSQHNSTVERRPDGSLLQASEQTSCSNMAPLPGQVTCDTSARAVLCLSELRDVVTRLQTKKLFPYNPSSLLQLLARVLDCSQQSHPSPFNK